MQPLVIELRSKAEAECVAEALEDFCSDLQTHRGAWTVAVDMDEHDFGPLFGALEECLRDNGMDAVRMSVGNRSYVMEAVS